jgi:hypothetical protein
MTGDRFPLTPAQFTNPDVQGKSPLPLLPDKSPPPPFAEISPPPPFVKGGDGGIFRNIASFSSGSPTGGFGVWTREPYSVTVP